MAEERFRKGKEIDLTMASTERGTEGRKEGPSMAMAMGMVLLLHTFHGDDLHKTTARVKPTNPGEDEGRGGEGRG